MKTSSSSKPSGIFTNLFLYLYRLPTSLRARLESWVPMGYENETGFHLDSEKEPLQS